MRLAVRAACVWPAGLLLAVCVHAAERWPDERVLETFVFHADFRLDSYQTLLEELVALRHQISQTLDLPLSPQPVHFYLLARESTYARYLAYYFPDVPQRPALYLKYRGPGMVFAHASGQLRIDLRHEATHAVLHSALPLVPLWLDEGLAEYFERPEPRALASPHLAAVRRHMRWRRLSDLPVLEQLRDLSEMDEAHYRDAWAWVHFLLHGPPEARLVLREYLADIQAHTPPGHLSQRLARRLPRAEQLLHRHFQQLSAR